MDQDLAYGIVVLTEQTPAVEMVKNFSDFELRAEARTEMRVHDRAQKLFLSGSILRVFKAIRKESHAQEPP